MFTLTFFEFGHHYKVTGSKSLTKSAYIGSLPVLKIFSRVFSKIFKILFSSAKILPLLQTSAKIRPYLQEKQAKAPHSEASIDAELIRKLWKPILMKPTLIIFLHKIFYSAKTWGVILRALVSVNKKSPIIILRREIVYKTNFRDFCEFLPNSRN